MAEPRPVENIPSRPALQGTAAALGICFFALCINAGWPWPLVSALGLLGVALTIVRAFLEEARPSRILGLAPLSCRVFYGLLPGCAGGIALGLLFRSYSDLPLFPDGLGRFIFVAVGIGATEEILFRGYIQGRFQVLGWAIAPLLAAAAHTLYKLALFAVPPEGVVVDYALLGVWTFIAGIFLGGLREWSGSVLPPLAGHVLFDILVYGERVQAPWWVWT